MNDHPHLNAAAPFDPDDLSIAGPADAPADTTDQRAIIRHQPKHLRVFLIEQGWCLAGHAEALAGYASLADDRSAAYAVRCLVARVRAVSEAMETLLSLEGDANGR
jgi:hypothetical protein